MKFLLDANMPRTALSVLAAHGHDAQLARDIGLSIAPDSVEVGLSPTSRPLTLACADGAWAVDVHSLALDTGAVGAVALASALPPRFNGAP